MARVQTRKPKDRGLSDSFIIQDIGFDSDDFVLSKTVGTTETDHKTVGTTETDHKTVGTTETDHKTVGTTETDHKTVGTTETDHKTVGTTEADHKTVGTTETDHKTVGTTETDHKTIGTTETDHKTVGTTETDHNAKIEAVNISKDRIKRLEYELDKLKRKNKLTKDAQRMVAAIKSESLIQRTDSPIIGYKKMTSREAEGYHVHPSYFRKALIELESKEIIERKEVSYAGLVKTYKWKIIET
jgi:HPt (histidine-containing phosphotransfer) domain-containing protein